MKKLLRKPFQRLASLMGIPQLQGRLDKQRKSLNNLERAFEGLSSVHHRNIRELYTHIDQTIFHELIQHVGKLDADRKEEIGRLTITVLESTNQLRAANAFAQDELGKLAGSIASLRQNVDRLRNTHTDSQAKPSPSSHVQPSYDTVDDSLYVALEDTFRGSRDLVTERQSQYLAFVEKVATKDHPLVDLGCGRGEWLHLLHTHSIHAYGVDSNQAALADCAANGLTTTHGDLLQHLKSLPDSSVGAITMFQVLEHLPFNTMLEVLREARRTLCDGGVFVGEIPNSETIRVGASTFWIDPTHVRPIFPGVLKFLATEVGFTKVDGLYSSPLAPDPDLAGLPEGAASAIAQLHQLVNGPGDFALIATA